MGNPFTRRKRRREQHAQACLASFEQGRHMVIDAFIERCAKHDAIIADKHTNENDAAILSFLTSPSQREIARALNIPKSTVGDAILRLKDRGVQRGEWVIA